LGTGHHTANLGISNKSARVINSGNWEKQEKRAKNQGNLDLKYSRKLCTPKTQKNSDKSKIFTTTNKLSFALSISKKFVSSCFGAYNSED
jgi:hypothetical protein